MHRWRKGRNALVLETSTQAVNVVSSSLTRCTKFKLNFISLLEQNGLVVELVDTPDSKPGAEMHESSSLSGATY